MPTSKISQLQLDALNVSLKALVERQDGSKFTPEELRDFYNAKQGRESAEISNRSLMGLEPENTIKKESLNEYRRLHLLLTNAVHELRERSGPTSAVVSSASTFKKAPDPKRTVGQKVANAFGFGRN